MNWKAPLAAAALLLLPALHLSAQTTRVAYVDIDRVTEKSEKINKAMGNISSKMETLQKDIEEKRKRLADLKAEIKKGEGVLAESELKKRRDESSKLEKDVVELEYQGRLEYQKLDNTLFEPMLKSIVYAIQEVAKERNIDLVLRGEAVIYGADAADITDEVVKKLNSPSFNPEKAASRTDKELSPVNSDENDTPTSETNSEKETPAAKESSSTSKESSSARKSESSASESAPKSSSDSIIPNLPLRTRPVDRQPD
jgi:outer membrane protein